ncbi:MAG: PilT/PilU family type 4a pilus ATPase [Myxococcales bacterium FL481]|nr:MAG: PilT/PilU family type 4a pilus ATPase [Myxococcales bacterium FL481]
MGALDRYLAYLQREDVDEVVLQSDRPAYVKLGHRYQVATKTSLTRQHLRTLWADTPVAAALRSRGESLTLVLDRADGRFNVIVTHRDQAIQVRVRRAEPNRVHRDRKPGSTPPDPAAPHEPSPRDAGEPRSASPGLDPTVPIIGQPEPISNPPVAREPAPSGHHTARSDRPDASRSGLLDVLVSAREREASDLHLMSARPPAMRLVGELEPCGAPVAHAELEAFVAELTTPAQREGLAQRGYTDFAVNVGHAGRFRVNVCRHQNGLKACFRLIPGRPPSPETLGLPEEARGLGKYHQGLVVISGPNGHGKTTTMSALLDVLNGERPIHIITVEDPVEIPLPVRRAIVNQREVGSHTASFPRALKAALREDPDVISIGELRDQETVAMALSAAETGHLVLATMSTPSGATTIDRLIDMFPPDEQTQVRATLSTTLKLVISQRLVPRASGLGRVAAVELITGNLALGSLIRENKLFQLPSLLQRGRAHGMIRLDDSLLALLEAGTIARETALAFADDPRRFESRAAAPAHNDPVESRPKRRRMFGG